MPGCRSPHGPPEVNWGNIKSFADLVNFLRRKQYWQYRYVTSVREALQVILFLLRRLGEGLQAAGREA